MDLTSFTPAIAEIFLATAAILLVLPAAFLEGKTAARLVRRAATPILLLTGGFAVFNGIGLYTIPGGVFATSPFALYMKILVLLAAVLVLLLLQRAMQADNRMNKPELPILILFAVLGMMVMISANDLMVLYMGLELQSLPLYVIAAMRRDSLRASEAGLKYFLLGALSSGLLLYGISLVYGFTGTTNYAEIAASLAPAQSFGGEVLSGVTPGVVVGIVFMLAGLAFKISAAPFHMWVPDVYEGAPTVVVAFFAVAPKLAALALFLQVTYGMFGEVPEIWQQILIALAALSVIVGALGAIMQTDLKRLMAYSSIAHMGYALVGMAAADTAGLNATMLYITIYVITTMGIFAAILSMSRENITVHRISDLAGLGRSNPVRAACIMVFMFSSAGIPPLGGFFGKWFAFLAAVEAGLVGLAVLAVLASVAGAFYYLRIVKVMYMDALPEIPLDKGNEGVHAVIITACALALLLLVFVMPELRADIALATGSFGFPHGDY